VFWWEQVTRDFSRLQIWSQLTVMLRRF
jgi:hypothetical protein